MGNPIADALLPISVKGYEDGRRGELKHLSSCRKRKQKAIALKRARTKRAGGQTEEFTLRVSRTAMWTQNL